MIRFVDDDHPGHVLIVDDEAAIVEILARYLSDEGFVVSEASDGVTAVSKAASDRPDLVLLDLNLPGLHGSEVFRRVRSTYDVPIIMLTSRTDEIDRVVGLELGADDYVGKPFSPREVVARVKSVLRRSRRAAADTGKTPTTDKQPHVVVKVGQLEIDRSAHEVRLRGATVNLTPTEFRLLDALATNIGWALTRDQLLDKVSTDADVYDRTLDRHIANLRRKIEDDPARPNLILTVLGVGYKIAAPESNVET
jgi:two-component system, OmpR family, alkaline phosphatase synthesis response regulator PhoP